MVRSELGLVKIVHGRTRGIIAVRGTKGYLALDRIRVEFGGGGRVG